MHGIQRLKKKRNQRLLKLRRYLHQSPKYHLWNRLVSPFMDCFAYRWMKKRYINYRIADNNLTEKA